MWFKVVFSLLFICGSFFASATAIFQYKNEKGVVVYTDQKPKKSGYNVVHLSCFACQTNSLTNWYTTPLFNKKHHKIIAKLAKKHQLDIALLKALIHAESGFNHQATSKKGAKGLMQLMPALAKHYKLKDPYQVKGNLTAGTAYFAKLKKRFNNNARLAAAAYNAGASNVEKYQGVPPFAETQAFVKRIDILRARYRKLAKANPTPKIIANNL